MKQYIGFVRDHSISMTHLAQGAARDYNANIKAVQDAANTHQLDTIVSTVMCGIRKRDAFDSSGIVKRDVVNSAVHMLKPIPEHTYETSGTSTPLLDSVGELIGLMETVPDADDKDVSFLLMIITDGEENDSRKWSPRSLTDKIRKLQRTDRWTFTFRVPDREAARYLQSMGVHEGNILIWEQSQRGIETASRQTVQAVSHFYNQRSKGVRSSRSFYADLRDVSLADAKRTLCDVSKDVQIFPVKKAGSEIRTFCEFATGGYLKGAAFYELSKPETVQDYKQIVIRDQKTKKVFAGADARHMLGLPEIGDVRLKPGDHGRFDIFIQSTSVNRKLMKGTELVYWTGAVL